MLQEGDQEAGAPPDEAAPTAGSTTRWQQQAGSLGRWLMLLAASCVLPTTADLDAALADWTGTLEMLYRR